MNRAADEDAIEQESDRLSSLPLDLIHHILSLMDTKYAVQTCVLSSKWKPIWTTLRDLNFSTSEFEQLGQFARFTRHVIAHRNDHTDVSSLELTFDGTLSQILIKEILNYAVSHNLHKLTINTCERDRKIPICIFECQSLNYLKLVNIDEDCCVVPQYPWDLPNLTTLHLEQIVLCDGRRMQNMENLDIFSKCVNLKNVFMNGCYLADVKVFNIHASKLEHLSLKDCFLQKLFIEAPKLQSFTFDCECPLSLSTNGFKCLETMDIHLPCKTLSEFKKEDARHVVNMFKNFHSAKFVNLYSDVIEALSLYPELLSSQSSPFHNLTHLNIRQMLTKEKYEVFIVPNNVKDYFLHSSPNATITTQLLKINELQTAARNDANRRNQLRYLVFCE